MRGEDLREGGQREEAEAEQEETPSLPPRRSRALRRTFWSSSESGITREVKPSSWDRQG